MDFDLHWIRPLWLLALPLAALPWLPAKRRGGPWTKVVDPALAPFLLRGGGKGGGAHGRALCCALLALGVLALAGPAYRQIPAPSYRSADALVVVLDVSRSMLAGDLTPSRLQRARLKIKESLRTRPHGETGLVAYSGHAFTVAPLTTDVATVVNLLDVLAPDIMPSRGSDTAAAIAKGHRLLQQADARKGRVLLLTDGAAGQRAIEAARALRSDGHMLLVLGTATPDGAPVPDLRGGFVRDDRSGLVVSRPDENAMLRLAREGGGAYKRITADNADLKELLGRGLRGRSAVRQAGMQVERWRDQGPLLLLLLAPLAALAFRRGWLLIFLAAPLPAFSAGLEFATADQQGVRAFAAGNYQQAAERFEDPSWRAAALYRQDRFHEAAQALEGLPGPTARYNRATAMARAGEIDAAMGLYEELLSDYPDHADARHNLEALQQRSGPHAGIKQAPRRMEAPAHPAASRRAQAATEDSDPLAALAIEQADATALPDLAQRWLQQVPDDPGGLLRRKFRRQYRAEGVDQDGNPLWPGDQAAPW